MYAQANLAVTCKAFIPLLLVGDVELWPWSHKATRTNDSTFHTFHAALAAHSNSITSLLAVNTYRNMHLCWCNSKETVPLNAPLLGCVRASAVAVHASMCA
jgi:hypothetical protein